MYVFVQACNNTQEARKLCVFSPCTDANLMDWWLMQEMVDFLVDIWHEDEGMFD